MRCDFNQARVLFVGRTIMQKVMLIGATLIGAVLFATTPVSVKWSALPQAAIANILAVDQAQARVGHPGSAVSVAGVNRRHRRAARRCATGVTC
jgi:hypothetical protein